VKDETAKIVTAYVKRNVISSAEIPALIAQVGASMYGLNKTLPAVEAREPAVPIRKSVTPYAVICLECGWKGQMLKRHLGTHDLDEASYRQRWGLKRDHALTAPNYALRRSEIAKSLGLGRRGRRAASASTPAPGKAPPKRRTRNAASTK
jgi:predicted transcriptional regulator